MVVVPVTEFMSEYGFYLLWLGLFDQSVENDDMFAPRKTKEIGIGMARPFGAVDFVEVLKREAHPPSQGLNAIPKFTSSERREFVKERLDNQRYQNDHDQLECHPKLGGQCVGPSLKILGMSLWRQDLYAHEGHQIGDEMVPREAEYPEEHG